MSYVQLTGPTVSKTSPPTDTVPQTQPPHGSSDPTKQTHPVVTPSCPPTQTVTARHVDIPTPGLQKHQKQNSDEANNTGKSSILLCILCKLTFGNYRMRDIVIIIVHFNVHFGHFTLTFI